MGGQDGFTRDLLNYNQETKSLLAGFRVDTSKKSELGINFAYTDSDAGLSPFDLPADDYQATHPTMSFDFSQSHTYSNLDVTRIDGDIDFKYNFNKDFWGRAHAKVVDFQDDAPYLEDTTGNVYWISVLLGWHF